MHAIFNVLNMFSGLEKFETRELRFSSNVRFQ